METYSATTAEMSDSQRRDLAIHSAESPLACSRAAHLLFMQRSGRFIYMALPATRSREELGGSATSHGRSPTKFPVCCEPELSNSKTTVHIRCEFHDVNRRDVYRC